MTVCHDPETVDGCSQKVAIMRDQQHAATKLCQCRGERLACLHIEVVAGLIEQQQIWFLPHYQSQRQAGLFATRKRQYSIGDPVTPKTEST